MSALTGMCGVLLIAWAREQMDCDVVARPGETALLPLNGLLLAFQ